MQGGEKAEREEFSNLSRTWLRDRQMPKSTKNENATGRVRLLLEAASASGRLEAKGRSFGMEGRLCGE